MESALYGIYALVVFVSEILFVRYAHSFDFWYVNDSCVNTVRQHFPWSILYIYIPGGRAKLFEIKNHYRDIQGKNTLAKKNFSRRDCEDDINVQLRTESLHYE